MYAFGLLTKYRVRDFLVPFWAVISPVICYFLNVYFTVHFKYRFGYELLIVNGLITFAKRSSLPSRMTLEELPFLDGKQKLFFKLRTKKLAV
jgi:hypothetical protein